MSNFEQWSCVVETVYDSNGNEILPLVISFWKPWKSSPIYIPSLVKRIGSEITRGMAALLFRKDAVSPIVVIGVPSLDGREYILRLEKAL